jgi:enoyl-CoA hydratase
VTVPIDVSKAEFETVRVDGPDEHGVVELTLNRPDHLNCASPEMYDELSVVARWLRNPDGVGAVVMTGAGRAFCAGADMQIIKQFADERFRNRIMEDGVHLVHEFLRIRPPVITALNGPAIGFGAALALLGDIVYMSEDATVADTHVRAGIVAGDGGALLWPALIGPSRAKEFLLTGDPIDAATADRLGLVTRVYPADEVHERSVAMARRLASGARHAIAWTKQVVNIGLLRDADWKLPLGNAHEARTQSMPDMAEGVAAFLAKRPARFPSATA